MVKCAAIGMSRLFSCLDWRFCLLQPSPLCASNVSSLTHFHHALSSFTCTLTPVEKRRAGRRQTTGNAGKSSLVTCFTGPGQYSQSSVNLASQPPPSENKIRDTSVCDGPGSHLLVSSITNKSRATDCFPSQCFAKAICIS